jgi:phage terminase small subunit
MAGNARSGRKPWLVVKGEKRPPLTMGIPDPPDELDGDPVALKYWHRLTKDLHTAKAMAHEYTTGLATLACVCADYERMRQQFKAIKFQAYYTTTENGHTRIHQTEMMTGLNKLAALRMSLLASFGLTPAKAVKLYGSVNPKMTATAEPDAPKRWDVLAGPR